MVAKQSKQSAGSKWTECNKEMFAWSANEAVNDQWIPSEASDATLKILCECADFWEELTYCAIIAPGTDDDWNTPGFYNSAIPLVEMVGRLGNCLIVNPHKTYMLMQHRQSENKEGKFHFNGLWTNYVNSCCS
eukprot:9191901-Karenia_brevis.AAC.1